MYLRVPGTWEKFEKQKRGRPGLWAFNLLNFNGGEGGIQILFCCFVTARNVDS